MRFVLFAFLCSLSISFSGASFAWSEVTEVSVGQSLDRSIQAADTVHRDSQAILNKMDDISRSIHQAKIWARRYGGDAPPPQEEKEPEETSGFLSLFFGG